MRRTKLLLLLLLCASSAGAQTVTNPSFEQSPPAPGSWNLGPVPGWTINGQAGLWSPTASDFATLPDGKTIAWVNSGSLSRDTGAPPVAGASYTFTVFVGHRTGGWVTNYTLSLNVGMTAICTKAGSNGTIPAGTFLAVTQTCTAPQILPSGNLNIVLQSAGAQSDFDDVSLIIAQQQTIPFMMTFPGSGTGSGFTVTVPGGTAIPTCAPAIDGNCSLVLTIVDSNGNVLATLTQRSSVTLSFQKTMTLPVPQMVTTPVATVTSP